MLLRRLRSTPPLHAPRSHNCINSITSDHLHSSLSSARLASSDGGARRTDPVLSQQRARSIMDKIRASMKAEQPSAAPMGSGDAPTPAKNTSKSDTKPGSTKATNSKSTPPPTDSTAALRSLNDDVRAAEQRAMFRFPPDIQSQLDDKLRAVQQKIDASGMRRRPIEVHPITLTGPGQGTGAPAAPKDNRDMKLSDLFGAGTASEDDPLPSEEQLKRLSKSTVEQREMTDAEYERMLTEPVSPFDDVDLESVDERRACEAVADRILSLVTTPGALTRIAPPGSLLAAYAEYKREAAAAALTASVADERSRLVASALTVPLVPSSSAHDEQHLIGAWYATEAKLKSQHQRTAAADIDAALDIPLDASTSETASQNADNLGTTDQAPVPPSISERLTGEDSADGPSDKEFDAFGAQLEKEIQETLAVQHQRRVKSKNAKGAKGSAPSEEPASRDSLLANLRDLLLLIESQMPSSVSTRSEHTSNTSIPASVLSAPVSWWTHTKPSSAIADVGNSNASAIHLPLMSVLSGKINDTARLVLQRKSLPPPQTLPPAAFELLDALQSRRALTDELHAARADIASSDHRQRDIEAVLLRLRLRAALSALDARIWRLLRQLHGAAQSRQSLWQRAQRLLTKLGHSSSASSDSVKTLRETLMAPVRRMQRRAAGAARALPAHELAFVRGHVQHAQAMQSSVVPGRRVAPLVISDAHSASFTPSSSSTTSTAMPPALVQSARNAFRRLVWQGYMRARSQSKLAARFARQRSHSHSTLDRDAVHKAALAKSLLPPWWSIPTPHHEPLLDTDQIQSIDELVRISLQTCHNRLPSDQSHVLYAIFESFPHFASAPSSSVNATSLSRTVLLENLLHSRMSLASESALLSVGVFLECRQLALNTIPVTAEEDASTRVATAPRVKTFTDSAPKTAYARRRRQTTTAPVAAVQLEPSHPADQAAAELAWLKTLEATLDPSLATPSTAINEGATDDSSSTYRIPRHFTNEKDKDGWAFYRLMLERYTNFGRGAALARLRNVERQVILEEHAAWKAGHSMSLTRVMHLPSAIQSDSPYAHAHSLLLDELAFRVRLGDGAVPLLPHAVVQAELCAKEMLKAARVELGVETQRAVDAKKASEMRSQHRQEQAKAGEEHDRRLAAYDELLDKYRHALGALGSGSSGSSAGRTVARAAHAIDDADALSDEAADAARRQL